MIGNDTDPKPRTAVVLGYLWSEMTASRRRQFAVVMGLMLVGMVADLLTIGAILPFLVVISDPERARQLPALGDLAAALGLTGPVGITIAAGSVLAVAAAFAAAARITVNWAMLRFILLFSHDIGTRVFGRMLRQPYSHFVMRNTSELIAGMEKVQTVIWGALMPGMQGLISSVTAVAIMLLLVAIDPFTAMIAAITMVGAYFLVSLAVRNRLRRNSERLAYAATHRVQIIQEGLGGIRDILLDRSQGPFEDKFRALDLDYRRAQAINNLIMTAPRYVIEATGIVLVAVLAMVMSLRPGGIIAALPVLGALALGAQRLLPMLQQAYNGWSAFAGNRQLVFDVISLMRMPVVAPAPAHGGSYQVFRQSITFDRVDFRYQGGEFALRDIDLSIPRGASVGFVGVTGSGKSTLLDVLMGLLEPVAGSILIDGVPLTDDNRADWQRQIAHVPQSIFLTDNSIAANIAFGQDDAAIDHDRIVHAARLAQVDQWVGGLDQGYATLVGERGLRLSGGQRQRIGIARAIYKRAPVLIFDEATSALDSATERRIIDAIGSASEDLTLLMIAHRTSTLTACDRIVRLDHGRIVEQGSYAEVIGPN